MRRTILALAMAAATLHGTSASELDTNPVNGAWAPDPDTDIVVLPMQRLALTEQRGKVRFVSGNGRYVFEGTLLDTWEQSEITNAADARRSASRVSLEAIGSDMSQLVPVSLGDGPEPIIAFVDDSDATLAFLDAVQPLASSHTIQLIFVPQHTSRATTLVHSACPLDHDALREALLQGSFSLDRDVEDREDCRGEALQHRAAAASFLDLHAMPAVIRSDSRIHRGEHPDWLAFLTEKSASPAHQGTTQENH